MLAGDDMTDRGGGKAPGARATNRAARRLKDAAVALFAARGLANVSMREVSIAAGNGNNSAVAYHFSGRGGLVDALASDIGAYLLPRYERLLDRLEALSDDRLTKYEVGLSLIAPLFALFASKPLGKELAAVLGRIMHEPAELSDPVHREKVTQVYRRFERLTLRLEPTKEREQVWYHIATIVMATVDGLSAIPTFSDVEVADRPDDRFDLLLHYNDFVCGGLLAITTDRPLGLDLAFWRGEIAG